MGAYHLSILTATKTRTVGKRRYAFYWNAFLFGISFKSGFASHHKTNSSPELVKQLSFGHFFLYPASLDTVLLPHVEQNLYRSFQSNRHLPCPTMAASSGTVKYGGMRN